MPTHTVGEDAYLRYTGVAGAVVDVNITVSAVCQGCGQGTTQVVMDEDEQYGAMDPIATWSSEHADTCRPRRLQPVEAAA